MIKAIDWSFTRKHYESDIDIAPIKLNDEEKARIVLLDAAADEKGSVELEGVGYRYVTELYIHYVLEKPF